MPLRDHFRPPLDNMFFWEGLFGMWPMAVVQYLRKHLPPGYVAEPRVQLGTPVDVNAPNYEVRVYDAKRSRRLVAALEIVSPANKDRPEHRNAFVAKCAALLREGVAVSIVDLVTTRHYNLYFELLAFVGHQDKTLPDPPPALYASSCRYVKRSKRLMLEAWSNAMTLGKSLPTIPLWLTADVAISLDLEQSYEQACHDLWIT